MLCAMERAYPAADFDRCATAMHGGRGLASGRHDAKAEMSVAPFRERAPKGMRTGRLIQEGVAWFRWCGAAPEPAFFDIRLF